MNASSITQVAIVIVIVLVTLILNVLLILWINKRRNNYLIKHSKDKEVEKESIVAGIESDEAEIDPDKIVGSTSLLADSIVSIVLNMSSKGPLSVCINGAWGSGKSTLINLAIPKLRRNNCTCIFFNAWHHESEHHLYAALIEQIRKSWIPRSKLSYPHIELREKISLTSRFKKWIKIQFSERLRIYSLIWWRRFASTPVQFISFLLVVFVSFLGFSYLFFEGAIFFLFEPDCQTINLFGLEFNIFNSMKLKSRMYFALLLISFTSWIFFWYSPYNTLKAFAAAPVSQVSARTPWLTYSQFAEQLSFRYRIAISFKEVCEALDSRNRRLVIIIDDLDRCNKDQILRIFEAVNFLCTSGPCFVLLAMDKERVIEMLGEKNNNEQYFRKFLEKIINLSVNVQPVSALEFSDRGNK